MLRKQVAIECIHSLRAHTLEYASKTRPSRDMLVANGSVASDIQVTMHESCPAAESLDLIRDTRARFDLSSFRPDLLFRSFDRTSFSEDSCIPSLRGSDEFPGLFFRPTNDIVLEFLTCIRQLPFLRTPDAVDCISKQT